MSAPLERLGHLLRPAGGGVYVVSTGLAEQRALQRRVYGAATDDDVEARWLDALSGIADAGVVVLGVPSDIGAGFTRGANRAPAALRAHLMDRPDHAVWTAVDAGDVRVVPQLLSDDMLDPAQRAACQQALYGPDAAADVRGTLPVAPLDMCRAALDAILELAPDVTPVVIGGDHSVGWPAFAAAHAHWEQRRGRRLGLLHFDAHTDLLETRLGIKYCFATWAWHANDLLGRDGRLVQIGVRASARPQSHWESTLGVRQIRAAEANARSVQSLADEIIERYARLGVDALYVSNDIDGTDVAFAAATGTPEPGGLHPDLVSGLTRAVAEKFPLVGGDLVEVAPPLAHAAPGEPVRTLDTAARYLADLVECGQRRRSAR